MEFLGKSKKAYSFKFTIWLVWLFGSTAISAIYQQNRDAFGVDFKREKRNEVRDWADQYVTQWGGEGENQVKLIERDEETSWYSTEMQPQIQV